MVRGKKDFAYANFLKKLRAIDPSLVKEVPPTDYREYIQRALWIVESENSDTCRVEQGTGFILQGYGLVTCAHVVVHPKMYAYRAADPTHQFPVTIVVQNKDIDLAILAIEAPRPDSLERESTKSPTRDEDLILAGYPSFAPGHTGIIDRCRIIGSHKHYTPERLLINRAIIYGNSGGPLLNMDFRVVGIAVTGTASEFEAEKTERHGIVPITALDLIKSTKS